MATKIIDNKYYMDEGFCVIKQKNITVVDKHTHDFVEFVYTLNGKCVHWIDGIEYPVRKGDLLFINRSSEHSIKSNDVVNYVDILIKPEYISNGIFNNDNVFSLLNLEGFEEFADIINPENCIVNFSGEDLKNIETLINMLIYEEKNNNPGAGIVLKSGMNMLLTMIFRKMSLPMRHSLGVDSHLLLYIKENCTNNISMEKIARKCGYSTAHFSRLFKEYSGINFSEYVTNCRIEKACRLLDEKEMPVEEIIYNCGFTNRTRFFKVFTEKVGITPKKYRDAQK